MAIPIEATAPLSVTRSYRPYYSPLELDQLSQLQSTSKSQPDLSQHRLNHFRQLACGYIERVGQRIGFPRRTIATAQSLYHRFHLHFPLRDFAYQDVSLSAILVASKLEDTLKKLRDIQITGFQIANMMEGGTGQSEGDSSAQEAHRPQLIGIERLILQTICFNFTLHRSLTSSSDSLSTFSTPELLSMTSVPTSKDLFSHLLRLSTLLPLPNEEAKSFTYLAFLLATDLFRTLKPLSYPPHTCAAACLRLTYFLYYSNASNEPQEPILLGPDQVGLEWSEKCESRDQDLDEIAQTLLNLLIALCPPPPSAFSSLPTSSSLQNVSPSFSPSQPSPSESGSTPTAAAATTTGNTARQTERDRQLLQSGIPNAFSHEIFSWSPSDGTGGGGSTGKGKRVITVDELREIKIRIRESGETRRKKRSRTGGAQDESSEGDGSEEQRSKRWKSLNTQGGMEEVQRLKEEAEERERFKNEEREEREREKESGKTEEEREREREARRDKRERMKPGSVRYMF
ncbi:Ctk2p [Sporobolomyces salmoneus]|uniref:Ctk2p n=1 Tax=Sporobolomyces salmoneus TaxID=183962 RepID=UPI00316C916B